jgi:hypothetical protein
MLGQDKASLLRLLDETRAQTLAALAKVDPDTPVYPEGGWLVRDVVGHLALWEEQVCLSLQAYSEGREYSIPNFSDENVYNEQDVERRRKQSVEQVLADFSAARARMKSLIEALSADQLSGDILCPWGSRSVTAVMIQHMAEHEAEHCQHIIEATRK